MGKVTINGVQFEGNNVTIINGKITIDGVSGVVGSSALCGVVEIRITEGTIGSLTTDASVTCGLVSGDVSAGGSVKCDSVGGSVNAGGSVRCEKVGGSINAGGSVRHV